MTDPKHVEESVDQIVKEFNGRLDIFVANSGIPWTQGAAIDGEVDHYRKVVSTDLDGTFFCARAAGKHWRRQHAEGTDLHGNKVDFPYGSFVATASMSGHIVNIPQLQARLQRRQGRRHPPGQVAGRRVGRLRARQQRVPRLHGDRDLGLCPDRHQEHVEGQDPHGGARARPRSSRARISTSPRLPRPTPPARTLSSTAATAVSIHYNVFRNLADLHPVP